MISEYVKDDIKDGLKEFGLLLLGTEVIMAIVITMMYFVPYNGNYVPFNPTFTGWMMGVVVPLGLTAAVVFAVTFMAVISSVIFVVVNVAIEAKKAWSLQSSKPFVLKVHPIYFVGG